MKVLPNLDFFLPACSIIHNQPDMAPHVTGRTKPTKPKKQQRSTKRKRDDVDVEKLEQLVQDLVSLA